MSLSPECLIEAMLLTQNRAVPERELRRLFEPPLPPRDFEVLMAVLAQRWQERGLVLSETAEGWRFYAHAEVCAQLVHLQDNKPPRYSRAVMETLAIIAYQQPVTRGDIEAIRGVVVSSQVMQTLQERGWIESIGQRDTLGRPALWATTAQFLADVQLSDLSDLPPLTELGQLILPETRNPAVETTAEEPQTEC